MKKRIPEKLRISVLNRDGRKCLWCGRSATDGVTLDVDHALAEHWNGETTEENLGTLCLHCNRAKGTDYYGNYLLSTLFKLKNKKIETWFEESVRHDLKGDRECHKLQIIFYREKNTVFLQQQIEQEYYIGGLLLETQGNADTDIKIEEIKKEAVLKLKDKVGDYLFGNKGFLEEIDSKIIFREKK